jgi:hypothetical protein
MEFQSREIGKMAYRGTHFEPMLGTEKARIY